MKILVIGNGGREHALVWRLLQSPAVKHVYCVPGNAGIAIEASCIPADIRSPSELANLADTLAVDVTVVGPEAPLVAGLVDEFQARALPIVGPTRFAAQLEGSKVFAKQFLERQGIPAAESVVLESPSDIESHIARFGFPVALKADGLAAGKGVVIVHDETEARQTATAMLAGQLVGPAGRRIVLEQFLQGAEVSFIVLSDGKNIFPFAPTQDHKPVFDNDQGPNTGGMGAYCDPAILTSSLQQQILSRIAQPTLDGIRQLGHSFAGFLYCGLMLTSDGPKVLEFNVRLGDPETQPLMYRLSGDLAQLLESTAHTRLDATSLSWKPAPTACVVLASKGYPGNYERGIPISGISDAESTGAKVFHAGTMLREGRLVTSGGRVLGVTAEGSTLAEALANTYAAVDKIHFEGMHFRRDIGKKGL